MIQRRLSFHDNNRHWKRSPEAHLYIKMHISHAGGDKEASRCRGLRRKDGLSALTGICLIKDRKMWPCYITVDLFGRIRRIRQAKQEDDGLLTAFSKGSYSCANSVRDVR